MKVFVYGTLLQGLPLAHELKDCEYLGPAMIQANLFDLGAYPGINEGEHTVIGELYEISEDVLANLDMIEGYSDDDIENSLFVRREVEARLFADGNYLPAYCYFYNKLVEEYPIFHGDYRRYLLEKSDEDQWVLSYGSNMSVQRLMDRVGEIHEYRPGFIEGFRLVFNKKAFGKQSVYANIAYVGKGAMCPAVAYRLTPYQLSDLDLYEGAPTHYVRTTVVFRGHSDEKGFAQVYIAHPDRLVLDGYPDQEYLEFIVQGYEEHGFDTSCLEEIL